jgi:hypothetical protein
MKAEIDKWEEWDFSCKQCGWTGKGSSLVTGDVLSEGCDKNCPSCSAKIAWLEFPLFSEMMANLDKLSPEIQERVKQSIKGHQEWHQRKTAFRRGIARNRRGIYCAALGP